MIGQYLLSNKMCVFFLFYITASGRYRSFCRLMTILGLGGLGLVINVDVCQLAPSNLMSTSVDDKCAK